MGQLANLLGYVLNYIYDIVQNYGIAIILFSVLLKIVMLPITIKQQSSMKKSAEMQDEMKKLQIKYKNDPEKQQKETMELYKREHFSPFSGCISGLLQLIIFLSVFYLVSRPLTYMKKVDTATIQNYENEIVESGEKSSYPEIKVIEEKSSEDSAVYINMEFLGLDLSKVPMQNWTDYKVYIIPLLYIITMIVNMKITTNMSKSNKQKQKEKEQKLAKKDNNAQEKGDVETVIVEETADDPAESMQQMTKSMNYMMPIMSISIAIIAPLGLSLYWFISNVLQLAERGIIDLVSNRFKKEEA